MKSNKSDLSKKYTDSYKVKNQINQGAEDLLPVSKKNSSVWNYISQNNSKQLRHQYMLFSVVVAFMIMVVTVQFVIVMVKAISIMLILVLDFV